MRRRTLLTALGVSILALDVRAQSPARSGPARVAILDDAGEDARARLWAILLGRLAELGHVEGRNLVVERRWARGDPAALPGLARELVALEPDVLVAVTTTAALAAQGATTRIPIVAIGPADPVRSGLVASLARPGGNVTGFSPNQAELAGKWLEIVRELAPRARTLAYLTDLRNPGEVLVHRGLAERGRTLGLDVRALDGDSAANLERAFATIAKERVDAMIVATTATLVPHARAIVDGAARMRLPAVYARDEYVDLGGLVSLGTDTSVLFARAAGYVDRILKGAQPAGLPFELASSYALVVNLAAARSLGLTLPASLLARADRVVS